MKTEHSIMLIPCIQYFIQLLVYSVISFNVMTPRQLNPIFLEKELKPRGKAICSRLYSCYLEPGLTTIVSIFFPCTVFFNMEAKYVNSNQIHTLQLLKKQFTHKNDTMASHYEEIKYNKTGK